MSSLRKILGRFRRAENGSATIEFVILFPMIMSIVLIGFESGYYMIRTVMLERAVDIAVRDVRLGNGRVPSFDEFRTAICENGALVENCEDTIQIEMRQVAVAPGGTDVMADRPACIDVTSNEDQRDDTVFDVGQINSMVIVRVCAQQKPFFPTTPMGAGLVKDRNGHFAMTVSTAFVTEPGNRAQTATATAALAQAADTTATQ